MSIPELFEARGEGGFRALEEWVAGVDLRTREPAVIALGGGAVLSDKTRETLRENAFTVFLDVDADTAWERCQGGDRPLAQDEAGFRRLFEERRAIYEQCADAAGHWRVGQRRGTRRGQDPGLQPGAVRDRGRPRLDRHQDGHRHRHRRHAVAGRIRSSAR